MLAAHIKQKYPDRVPVIIARSPTSTSVPEIDKRKYLVPTDLTIGQFIYVIRRRIRLGPQQALFVFIDNRMLATALLMSQVYQDMKSPDGFLYIQYAGENTFG